MALIVVIGPPAAGKSTWVGEHAKRGDITVDFDKLALALSVPGGDPHDHPAPLIAVARAARNAAIEAGIKQADRVDVYVIHSNPGAERLAEYRGAGARVVTVDPGRDVVRERCKTQRPARMFAAIDAWYKEHGPQRGRGSGAPAFDFEPVTSRSW